MGQGKGSEDTGGGLGVAGFMAEDGMVGTVRVRGCLEGGARRRKSPQEEEPAVCGGIVSTLVTATGEPGHLGLFPH